MDGFINTFVGILAILALLAALFCTLYLVVSIFLNRIKHRKDKK